jgi:hypothetical protein
MGTFADLLAATAAAGMSAEGTAQLLKIEDICGGLTSQDFGLLATEDYAAVKATLVETGLPDEAIAELEKIKALLINA